MSNADDATKYAFGAFVGIMVAVILWMFGHAIHETGYAEGYTDGKHDRDSKVERPEDEWDE